MNGKPKIALCISGEPRNSMISFPYIYESILNPDLGFEVDVYIHSFKPYRTIELYSPKEYKIEMEDDYIIYDRYASRYNMDIVKFHHTPFRNTFLMYYGIKEVFNLIRNYNYDFYIRCRPDIMFHSRLNLEYIISSLSKNNIDMWAPNLYEYDDWRNVVNDQLAVCNLKSFKVYSEVIDNLAGLVKQTDSFYPEGLLAAALHNNNLKIEAGVGNYSLIRKVMVSTKPSRPIITFD